MLCSQVGRIRGWADIHATCKEIPARLRAFSDCVFVVLITVLVLELRPPDTPTFKVLLSLLDDVAPRPVAFYAAVFFFVNVTYICLIRELIETASIDDVPLRQLRIMRSDRSQRYLYSGLLRSLR